MIMNPGLLFHLKLIFCFLNWSFQKGSFGASGLCFKSTCFPSYIFRARIQGTKLDAEHPAQSPPCSHAPHKSSVTPDRPAKVSQHAAVGDVKLKAGSMHKISNLLLSFWSSRFLPSLSLLVSLIFFVLDFLHGDNLLLDYFWGVCCMDTHWPFRDGIGIPVRVFSIGREKERVSSRGGVLYRAGLHRLKFIIIPLQATGGHSSTNSYGSYSVLKNVSVEHEVSVLISPQHSATFKFLLIMWQMKS